MIFKTFEVNLSVPSNFKNYILKYKSLALLITQITRLNQNRMSLWEHFSWQHYFSEASHYVLYRAVCSQTSDRGPHPSYGFTCIRLIVLRIKHNIRGSAPGPWPLTVHISFESCAVNIQACGSIRWQCNTGPRVTIRVTYSLLTMCVPTTKAPMRQTLNLFINIVGLLKQQFWIYSINIDLVSSKRLTCNLHSFGCNYCWCQLYIPMVLWIKEIHILGRKCRTNIARYNVITFDA